MSYMQEHFSLTEFSSQPQQQDAVDYIVAQGCCPHLQDSFPPVPDFAFLRTLHTTPRILAPKAQARSPRMLISPLGVECDAVSRRNTEQGTH
jgi:hypothetical protein